MTIDQLNSQSDPIPSEINSQKHRKLTGDTDLVEYHNLRHLFAIAAASKHKSLNQNGNSNSDTDSSYLAYVKDLPGKNSLVTDKTLRDLILQPPTGNNVAVRNFDNDTLIGAFTFQPGPVPNFSAEDIGADDLTRPIDDARRDPSIQPIHHQHQQQPQQQQQRRPAPPPPPHTFSLATPDLNRPYATAAPALTPSSSSSVSQPAVKVKLRLSSMGSSGGAGGSAGYGGMGAMNGNTGFPVASIGGLASPAVGGFDVGGGGLMDGEKKKKKKRRHEDELANGVDEVTGEHKKKKKKKSKHSHHDNEDMEIEVVD
ncbi:hypothetical protein HDU80_010510 [Chytriomyces hyalinus]|nr:hypothetical protein HDU80_010510 [Chytriomyces hyalinus]